MKSDHTIEPDKATGYTSVYEGGDQGRSVVSSNSFLSFL